MANTYTLISSNTLGADTATVTFSSIPSTYTDLVLRFSFRTDATQIPGDILLTFNGSSATTYSNTSLAQLDASSSYTERYANQTSIYAKWIGNANTSTANTFGNGEIYIASYLANQNKPVSIHGVAENNAPAARNAVIAGLWRDTSAINSITLTPASGASLFLAGSSFYLYGIKNS